MICNASRTDKMIIDRTDLERAIEILKFTEVKMVDTFSGVGKSNNADVLTRVMNEIGTRGSMLKQDLVKMFYFDADARTMDSVIETLKSMNFLQIRQEGRDTYIEHKGEKGATLGDPDPQGVARIDSSDPRK